MCFIGCCTVFYRFYKLLQGFLCAIYWVYSPKGFVVIYQRICSVSGILVGLTWRGILIRVLGLVPFNSE